MATSGSNVRFQLLVNGKAKAIGGIELFGVLNVILTWVRRDASRFSRKEMHGWNRRDWTHNKVSVYLGGLNLATDKHVDWYHDLLKVGDEVMVKILGPGDVDEPKSILKEDRRKTPRRARVKRKNG